MEFKTLNLADISVHTNKEVKSADQTVQEGKKLKKKQRNWTKEELSAFVQVLVEYKFVQTLEQKALKKSANIEVFKEVLPLFKGEIEKEDFIALNETKNFTRKGVVVSYAPLLYDATTLQGKYKDLKTRWRNITTSARRGSGEEGATDATWYQLLNPILSETNGDLSEIINDSDDLHEYEQWDGSEDIQVQEAGTVQSASADQQVPEKKPRLTVTKITTPRVRTQSQGLAVLGRSLTEFGNQQSKNLSAATEKANERHESYLKFMAEQRALDREHELAMFKMLLQHTQSHHPAPSHTIPSVTSAFNTFVPQMIPPTPTSTPFQNQDGSPAAGNLANRSFTNFSNFNNSSSEYFSGEKGDNGRYI